jgi:DNA mismatch endonuclease (patch repair protein)
VADVLTREQRSYCMSRIQGRNTKPEILLRRTLWKLGLRYRLKSKLPGKPDLVFPGARLVVFVDGCQWHCCPDHFVRPKSNQAFWDLKFEKNRARDTKVNELLDAQGWKVLRFWEHEVEQTPVAIAERISKVVIC